MPELTIEDFEDIENCPICTGALKGDTIKGMIIKICRADRRHGYFTVNYNENDGWFIEYSPFAP